LRQPGQQAVGVRGDKAALGLQRPAAHPGDGGRHPRIAEVQVCLAQARLGQLQVGARHILGGQGVVVLALADRALGDQRLEPGNFAPGLGVACRGTGELGARLGHGDLERRRVDQEQRRARRHRRAFLVLPLEDDAGYPGAHFDFARAFGLSDVLVADVDVPGLDLQRGHFGRRHRGRTTLRMVPRITLRSVAAGQQRRHRHQQAGEGSAPCRGPPRR
jgi:hypothetical protein